MFWTLCAFFRIIPLRLNFICWHFRTLHTRIRIPTRVWRWNRQSAPKCRYIIFRCWGITQKKAYNNSGIISSSITNSYNVAVIVQWKSITQSLYSGSPLQVHLTSRNSRSVVMTVQAVYHQLAYVVYSKFYLATGSASLLTILLLWAVEESFFVVNWCWCSLLLTAIPI